MSSRPPLRRLRNGRVLAGVCAGISDHLQIPVVWVRVIVLALGVTGGVGVAVYAFLWVNMPSDDPSTGLRPELERLIPAQLPPGKIIKVTALILGSGMLVAATMLLAARFISFDAGFWIPVVAFVSGVAVVWTQIDSANSVRQTTLWVGAGTLLALAGIVFFMLRSMTLSALLAAAMAAGAIVLGIGIVLAPWIARWMRSLGEERAERARQTERAAIATHLHDSVLQSLALIRTHATDTDTVHKIARRQERELREWLYLDRPAPGTSVVSQLRAEIAAVEDDYGIPIDPVFVGDVKPTPAVAELVAAVAEALKNAVRHGQAPVSVFVESNEDSIEAFVRDHGHGFDPAAIPANHFGVRESIIGRIQRAGGTATFDVRPGRGTEVRLVLPIGKDK